MGKFWWAPDFISLIMSILFLFGLFIYKPKLQRNDICFILNFIIFVFLSISRDFLVPKNNVFGYETLGLARDLFGVYFSYYGTWYFFIKRNLFAPQGEILKNIFFILSISLSLFLFIRGTSSLIWIFRIDIPFEKLIVESP